MLVRYFSASGDRHIQCLSPGLHQMLYQLIPVGGGDDLLRDVQDLVCEVISVASVHSRPWLADVLFNILDYKCILSSI